MDMAALYCFLAHMKLYLSTVIICFPSLDEVKTACHQASQ
jgi:hypothetical protein